MPGRSSGGLYRETGEEQTETGLVKCVDTEGQTSPWRCQLRCLLSVECQNSEAAEDLLDTKVPEDTSVFGLHDSWIELDDVTSHLMPGGGILKIKYTLHLTKNMVEWRKMCRGTLHFRSWLLMRTFTFHQLQWMRWCTIVPPLIEI